MSTNLLFICFLSFLSGISLLILFRKLSLEYNVLIYRGIPLIGGIAIGLTLCLAILFSHAILKIASPRILGIIIPAFAMLFFGLIDDWRELSVSTKALVQVICISILVSFGIRARIVYIGEFLNVIITFVWMLGITNAFNHLDVMDGVAATAGVLASLSFFIISVLNNDANTAVLTLSLATASLSFLIYNFPPAAIYLGNSGSHFLGFVLAAAALNLSYASLERKTALLTPLLILGLPIFDTAFVILMRIKQGRSIFRKSNDHLSLRFLKLGYSKNKTLLSMSLLAVFFSLSGIALSKVSGALGICIILLSVLVGLVITCRMYKVSVDG
jgi:UDP-GlcNAc:undecaprenyl-phosphate GlcNAc-1-phosphate transferase